MNIVVCVKYVPDATADRQFESDNTVDRVGVDGLLSELDEYAVEQALKLKEKAGDDTKVTALCVGPEKAVDAVRKAHPGYRIAVTGLAVIAARNSAGMIDKLSHGLTIEFAFVALFIGLAFRSWIVDVSSIMPAIVPVVACGALLRLSGLGLQFASIVALIVSFGLGLSATIHFFNRMRLEQRAGEDAGSPSSARRFLSARP